MPSLFLMEPQMNWIMIAMLGTNLIVSQHPSEELCRGRLEMLKKEHKAYGDCVKLMPNIYLNTTQSCYQSDGTVTSGPC